MKVVPTDESAFASTFAWLLQVPIINNMESASDLW